ncbi:MAG: hypothetical protein DCC67_02325 [Planctomycetota bacterium]|nr:MAG: hypothetical protein DCC67_02325 [Planctomycetota bacterium]
MTLNLDLSPELAERLEKAASASSTSPERIAVTAIERTLALWERADQALAPVHAAFEASGMSDDELAELIDAEIHAMRRDRRASQSSSAER